MLIDTFSNNKNLKNFMAPFFMNGVQLPEG